MSSEISDDKVYLYAFVRGSHLNRALEEGLGEANDFFPVFVDHEAAAEGARRVIGSSAAIIRIDVTGYGTSAALDDEAPVKAGVMIDALPGVFTYYVGKADPSRLEVSEPSLAPIM